MKLTPSSRIKQAELGQNTQFSTLNKKFHAVAQSYEWPLSHFNVSSRMGWVWELSDLMISSMGYRWWGYNTSKPGNKTA